MGFEFITVTGLITLYNLRGTWGDVYAALGICLFGFGLWGYHYLPQNCHHYMTNLIENYDLGRAEVKELFLSLHLLPSHQNSLPLLQSHSPVVILFFFVAILVFLVVSLVFLVTFRLLIQPWGLGFCATSIFLTLPLGMASSDRNALRLALTEV